MTIQPHGMSRRALLAAGGAFALSSCASPAKLGAAFTPRAIDVHHHLLSPTYVQRHGDDVRRTAPAFVRVLDWTPRQSVEEMDKAGVQTAIVSHPGGYYANDIAESRALCREINEFAAKMKADYPGRFGSFAVVPTPDVEGSLREIAYVFDTLKAEGVAMATNYDGKYLGDPAFAPVMEELNRRAAAVYVHPTTLACCVGLVPNLPPQAIEFPFDTMRTIASLMYSRTLARMPNIKFIFAHGGGALGQLSDRLGQFVRAVPGNQDVAPNGPKALYQKLYVDTASIENAPAMAATRALLPPSQILYGTDFPYLAMAAARERLRTLDIPAADLALIEHGNAARLFPGLTS